MATLGVALSIGVVIPLISVSDSAFAAEGLGSIPYPTSFLSSNASGDSTTTYYTVQTGDTLSRIAEKHNADIEVLKTANGISQHEVLKVGQVLRVPTADSTLASVYSGGVGGDLPALTVSDSLLAYSSPDSLKSNLSIPGSDPGNRSMHPGLPESVSGVDISGGVTAANETLVSFSESGALVAVNQVSTVSSASEIASATQWQSTVSPTSSIIDAGNQPISASASVSTTLYLSSPSREKEIRDSLATDPNPNSAALNREQLNTRLSQILDNGDHSRQPAFQALLNRPTSILASSAPVKAPDPSPPVSASQTQTPASEGAWSVVDAAAPTEAQMISVSSSSQSSDQASLPNGNDVLAAAPLGADTYSPFSDQAVGQSVSPDMPILPGVREFFPEVPSNFNGYLWPARGILSSGYGWRWGRMHRGIDIAGPIGTPVVAAAGGVVVRSGWNSGGYGNVVDIRHSDGSMTRYAHNSRLLVREGQAVRQGQLISEIGSTGNSTGPHLHFEIHLPSTGTVNPIAYLPSR
ncbi:MAG: peptidoglycan DD-metalloendopeptidase family protein [Nodosilinea sp.]